jgi:hypothetical protein
MAIKKSDLYSSLWASCDELRGGMDASQYKDYVLFMLFIKYVTDKYGNSTDFALTVAIPKGASFKEMLALRGKSDIGDKINTQVIAPLVQAKVERLTNLVNIFASPQLDFSQNRADHDAKGKNNKLVCGNRRARHPASSSSVRATTSGDDVTCSPLERKRRSPPSVSIIAPSRSPYVRTAAKPDAQPSCTNGTSPFCTLMCGSLSCGGSLSCVSTWPATSSSG